METEFISQVVSESQKVELACAKARKGGGALDVARARHRLRTISPDQALTVTPSGAPCSRILTLRRTSL